MATVSAQQLFGAVLLGVCLGGFGGVMRRVCVMSVGGMRVMRGFFVKAGIVMFRRRLVMACRVFVVLRRFPMMLCRFFRHQASFVSGLPDVGFRQASFLTVPSPAGHHGTPRPDRDR